MNLERQKAAAERITNDQDPLKKLGRKLGAEIHPGDAPIGQGRNLFPNLEKGQVAQIEQTIEPLTPPVVSSVEPTRHKPRAKDTAKGYRLFVDPQLVARSCRIDDLSDTQSHARRALWLYHIARFLDHVDDQNIDSSGFVYIADMLKTAQKLDSAMNKAEFDKYLRWGEKAGFWTCSRQARRGETAYRRKLFYTAETKIMLAGAGQDGTNWPGAPKVEIPLRWGKYLPFAYAAWFRVLVDEKTRARMRVDGTKKRSKRLRVVSISRASIQAVWGISPHTQIKWENAAGVTVRHSRVQYDEKTNWSDIPDYARPYLTNDGKEQWSGDGVNTYAPPKMKVSKSKQTRLSMRRQYRAKIKGMDSDAQPLSDTQQPAADADIGALAGQGTQRPFEPIYHDYQTARDGLDALKKTEHGRQKRRGKTKDPLPPRKQQVTLGNRGAVVIRQELWSNRPVQTTPLAGIDYRRMATAEWEQRRADLVRWKGEYHAA